LPALLVLLPAAAIAAPPNFSGTWTLDRAKSDDPRPRIDEAAGSEYVKGGGTSPLTILPMPGTAATVERVELRDWMLRVAAELDHLEIEHGPGEIKLFHGADIARTFYFGREHVRQDAQGRKLKCQSRWEGEQLVLDEKGDKGRRLTEMLSLDPSGLLVQHVRWEDKLLKKPLELSLVYDRADPAKAP